MSIIRHDLIELDFISEPTFNRPDTTITHRCANRTISISDSGSRGQIISLIRIAIIRPAGKLNFVPGVDLKIQSGSIASRKDTILNNKIILRATIPNAKAVCCIGAAVDGHSRRSVSLRKKLIILKRYSRSISIRSHGYINILIIVRKIFKGYIRITESCDRVGVLTIEITPLNFYFGFFIG